MRLFIAEKPSLGKAIAAELGVTQTCQGYTVCGNDAVTWCFGHLLEQYDPDDYDDAWKLWRRSSLPMIPHEWRLKPKESAHAQLQVIKKLLGEAATVVNTGDPDREGQLLVDEVLEHFRYTGPVQRIWLASLDSRSIQKALATLKDNRDYANLRDSARARSQADWLIGMNATRAMTLRGRESGRDGVLSMGRVQTPTLALVVNRDREIAAFTPIDYLVFRQGSSTMRGRSQPSSSLRKHNPDWTVKAVSSMGPPPKASWMPCAAKTASSPPSHARRRKSQSLCRIAFPRFRRPRPPSSA